MRLDVEALKHQVSDQPHGGNGNGNSDSNGNGVLPPDIQGPQNRSGPGPNMYQGRVGGRFEEGPGGREGGVGQESSGEGRADLLEVENEVECNLYI